MKKALLSSVAMLALATASMDAEINYTGKSGKGWHSKTPLNNKQTKARAKSKKAKKARKKNRK